MTKRNIKTFEDERHAALSSLNEEQIRAFYIKWNGCDLPEDKNLFWCSVHKAITADTGLPKELRRKSRQWLTMRSFTSLDDGDL